MTSYDETPYTSNPFVSSTPERCYTATKVVYILGYKLRIAHLVYSRRMRMRRRNDGEVPLAKMPCHVTLTALTLLS